MATGLLVDNGNHFVKGKLPEKLKEVGTKLFSAPVMNPQSVGLIERNVQLVLAGFRAMVESSEVRKSGMKLLVSGTNIWAAQYMPSTHEC